MRAGKPPSTSPALIFRRAESTPRGFAVNQLLPRWVKYVTLCVLYFHGCRRFVDVQQPRISTRASLRYIGIDISLRGYLQDENLYPDSSIDATVRSQYRDPNGIPRFPETPIQARRIFFVRPCISFVRPSIGSIAQKRGKSRPPPYTHPPKTKSTRRHVAAANATVYSSGLPRRIYSKKGIATYRSAPRSPPYGSSMNFVPFRDAPGRSEMIPGISPLWMSSFSAPNLYRSISPKTNMGYPQWVYSHSTAFLC